MSTELTDERALFEKHFFATPEQMHPVAWDAWQARALADRAAQQEPAGWVYDCGGGGRMYACALDKDNPPPGWQPLYAAPSRSGGAAALSEASGSEPDSVHSRG